MKDIAVKTPPSELRTTANTAAGKSVGWQAGAVGRRQEEI